MRQINVVVYGCGSIGRGVLERLHGSVALFRERFGLEFRVLAAVDSSGMAAATAATAAKAQALDIPAVLAWKGSGKPLAEMPAVGTTEADWPRFAGGDAIVVDTAASPAGLPGLLAWVTEGRGGAVLANKTPITACTTAEFRRLTAPEHMGRFRYESTVGAGTPFVSTVSRVLAGADTVGEVRGTFSGTLGYITSGLDDGRLMSELVRTAHAESLTEPDPRDDLSGTDVARKALILARTLGWDIGMEDIAIEALYPASMQALSVPEFLDALPDSDADVAGRLADAQRQDAVLRYIATVRDGKCTVGLRSVPRDSPFGSLKGTDNMLVLSSQIYSASPLVVVGSGAGVEVTAAGIVSDMVDMSLQGLDA